MDATQFPPKNSFRFIEFSSFSAAQVAVRFVPKMADSTKTKFQTIQLVLQVPAGDLLKFKYRTVVNELNKLRSEMNVRTDT